MGRAGRDYEDRGGRDGGRGRDDWRRDDRPSYGYQPRQDEAAGETVTGTLKFYDPNKGFGFVNLPSKGIDAFLHVTALPPGTDSIPDGSTVTGTVKPDARKGGKLAFVSVDAIDGSTAQPRQASPASARRDGGFGKPQGPQSTGAGELTNLVEDRGFGFVRLDNGKRVFVHFREAEQAGIELTVGERYVVDYVEVPEKGPKAVAIRRG